MNRILLLIEHQQNRRMLFEWLQEGYEVLGYEDSPSNIDSSLLDETFDLCLIDLAAIQDLRQKILTTRELAIPIFLPFVLLTALHNISFSTDSLERLVDDIVYLPTKKQELNARLRVLLRSRSYSLQLKTAQAELKQALSQEKELNQLKSRFVSTVSHEFRNPLNSISGVTQILQTYGDRLSEEKRTEVLNQLQRNVAKMTQLLEDVLIIGRKDLEKIKLQPQPLNLEAFCRGLISEIQTAFDRQQSIEFTYQAAAEFNLDRKLLHYILSNLLSNACKYSPQDSSIDFAIKNTTSEIIFTIGDRGLGIPSQDLPHLFDSFYRASNSEGFQGTGLGLAIAKEYTELHQGTISIDSELEVGTTFTVTIPTNLEFEPSDRESL